MKAAGGDMRSAGEALRIACAYLTHPGWQGPVVLDYMYCNTSNVSSVAFRDGYNVLGCEVIKP